MNLDPTGHAESKRVGALAPELELQVRRKKNRKRKEKKTSPPSGWPILIIRYDIFKNIGRRTKYRHFLHILQKTIPILLGNHFYPFFVQKKLLIYSSSTDTDIGWHVTSTRLRAIKQMPKISMKQKSISILKIDIKYRGIDILFVAFCITAVRATEIQQNSKTFKLYATTGPSVTTTIVAVGELRQLFHCEDNNKKTRQFHGRPVRQHTRSYRHQTF